MIHHGTIRLEFGSGTIRCCFGGEKGRGVLMFKEGEPTKIGTYQDERIDGVPPIADFDDYPVTLVFSNTESVDAVIESLNKVREIIEGKLA